MELKKFKQLCFNELTLQPMCADETEMHNRVLQYVRTLQKAQISLGAKMVRYGDDLSNIKLSEDTSLRQFCVKHRNEVGIVALLSSATMPQINPNDASKNQEFEKTQASVKIDNDWRNSYGLASAYVYDVPSIGFESSVFWTKTMYDVRILSDGKDEDVKWPCLTNPEHLKDANFIQWIQMRSEIELKKSELTYEQKIKCLDDNLRDDHGKDVLKDHAKRLCHCDYVEGILCSRSFQPKFGTYIYNLTPDGLIDIVLFWDDRGLSMRVKTTGRNEQETAAIAAILKKKYSK